MRPAEHLCGFALLTDDDLSSLSHVATTSRFCAQSRVAQAAFLPTQWAYREGHELFDLPRHLLTTAHDASRSPEAMEDHVEHAFMALEAALLSAREDDLVDDEVLLVVTATDPGPRLFKLMTKAAEGLNSPELFARWLAAQGQ